MYGAAADEIYFISQFNKPASEQQQQPLKIIRH